jgi:hypothetical protein
MLMFLWELLPLIRSNWCQLVCCMRVSIKTDGKEYKARWVSLPSPLCNHDSIFFKIAAVHPNHLFCESHLLCIHVGNPQDKAIKSCAAHIYKKMYCLHLLNNVLTLIRPVWFLDWVETPFPDGGSMISPKQRTVHSSWELRPVYRPLRCRFFFYWDILPPSKSLSAIIILENQTMLSLIKFLLKIVNMQNIKINTIRKIIKYIFI